MLLYDKTSSLVYLGLTQIQTPLGFFTSFFGMNNSSTGSDWMTLWQQLLVMRKTSRAHART